jgi:hypothetical protein
MKKTIVKYGKTLVILAISSDVCITTLQMQVFDYLQEINGIYIVSLFNDYYCWFYLPLKEYPLLLPRLV